MTADFYDDDDREPMALGHILYEKPAADRRKIRYPWRETVMAILPGEIRNSAQAAVLLFETEQLSRRLRQPGQHCCGPLTRAFRNVMRGLLDLTHFATGRCTASYETIAERSGVGRSTVPGGIEVIEALTGMRTYRRVLPVSREVRKGFWSPRTTNVYVWRLNANARKLREARGAAAEAPKSRNRPETFKHTNCQSSLLPKGVAKPEAPGGGGVNTLEKALARMRATGDRLGWPKTGMG